MMRSLLFLLLLLVSTRPAVTQETPIWELPPREQMQRGYIDRDWLSGVLPGFVDVGWAHPCIMEVYLVDLVLWGDSARALLQPYLQSTSGRTCPTVPELRLVRSRYSQAELLSLVQQIEILLEQDPLLHERASVGTLKDSISIHLPDRAAMERARAILVREPHLPHDQIRFRVPSEPQKPDFPDSLFMRPRADRRPQIQEGWETPPWGCYKLGVEQLESRPGEEVIRPPRYFRLDLLRDVRTGAEYAYVGAEMEESGRRFGLHRDWVPAEGNAVLVSWSSAFRGVDVRFPISQDPVIGQARSRSDISRTVHFTVRVTRIDCEAVEWARQSPVPVFPWY